MLKRLANLNGKQFRVKIKGKNPLLNLWKLNSKGNAEKLKKEIISKFDLGIGTRAFESYIYTDNFPLYFAKILIDEFGSDEGDKIWRNIEQKLIAVQYRATRGGRSKWLKPPKISPELLYLAGAMRDGNINTRINRIAITQHSCTNWLEGILIPMFFKLFGVEPSIQNGKLVMYSGAITLMLIDLLNFPPTTQLEWGRVNLVDNVDLKLQLKYIQGYFDAEGTSNPKRKTISISQHSSKNELNESLIQVQQILKRTNIDSKLFGPYKKGNTFLTLLTVYGKRHPRNTELFITKVGSLHLKKSERLALLLK